METEACEATCCAVAFTDHSPDCELHAESSAASHRDASDRKGSDGRGPSGVHERQAATMSQEAREFLRHQQSMLMPASYTETASPAQVPASRVHFQAQEDIIEEKLIAEHDLLLEYDTILAFRCSWSVLRRQRRVCAARRSSTSTAGATDNVPNFRTGVWQVSA
jgi:hypothetical protein